MGYLTNFYRDSHQKELKKRRRKDKSSLNRYIQSADRPETECKVACNIIKSVKFGKIYGFYDVTGNFELDFQAIG